MHLIDPRDANALFQSGTPQVEKKKNPGIAPDLFLALCVRVCVNKSSLGLARTFEKYPTKKPIGFESVVTINQSTLVEEAGGNIVS